MKIKSVSLKTDRLAELLSFYSGTLGMDLVSQTDAGFTLDAGGSELTFDHSSEHTGAFYHFAFNIPENQFDDSIKWLEGKADLITLDGEHIFDFKAWDAHSIYFYDPAGNIVEFIARHRLNNSSDKEFSGKSILSISEMGMPVKNVRKFYERLYGDLDLPLFTGDLKTFTAGGDDNGLIIIVPEERNWFPDCPHAEIFPIALEIEGIKKGEVLLKEYQYSIVSKGFGAVSD
jgi:catechol 2,3-dioxygenase-like lactoylglutathione lyase family enzyme